MGQTQPFKLKVLVDDDDEDVLAVETALLEEEGHEVLSASGAREAFQLLDTNRDIDLLFTDIVLPGPMDGFRLTETAKVMRPHLRVIYTSGYLKDEGVWDGALLPKPWTQDDLRAAIADIHGPPRSQGLRRRA